MVLKIERFQPEGMNVRMSGGKPSYSHVVAVSGSGKIVYTAGQLARDIDGNCVGKGDMRAQMEQTFQNLDRCLKAAGATWADVVKTNTFVTDYEEYAKHGDMRLRYFGPATPTSTTVVAISTSISRRTNRSMIASFSRAGRRPWSSATRTSASGPVRSASYSATAVVNAASDSEPSPSIAGATFPLVNKSFTPDGAASLVTDGLTASNVPSGFLSTFPYLGVPYSGFNTPSS